jgi:hypothetical protein
MSKRVVNLRAFGATMTRRDVERIDRLTVWGNPVHMDDFHGPKAQRRAMAIAEYRGILAILLADNPAFLEPLRGKRLACWCAPLPCHGDVIAEFVP